uniref:Uncharacterized protein n=2 Tax=Candidatus Kentrum sp. DK TaxID=2126562 RepID=A0A450S184_9GAMM|nr:MAG: hypothetical protein BECKDK2373C_GA0170839_10112 [Candidatus Kentron sp. DK]
MRFAYPPYSYSLLPYSYNFRPLGCCFIVNRLSISHSRLLHNCLILNKIFGFVFVNYLCFESTC